MVCGNERLRGDRRGSAYWVIAEANAAARLTTSSIRYTQKLPVLDLYHIALHDFTGSTGKIRSSQRLD
jgi:hypothetical protein